MEENNRVQMCEHCKAQEGKGRNDEPHAHLKSTRFDPWSYEGKTANEHYYKCSICGHEWLHETGNCGEGWR